MPNCLLTIDIQKTLWTIFNKEFNIFYWLNSLNLLKIKLCTNCSQSH